MWLLSLNLLVIAPCYGQAQTNNIQYSPEQKLFVQTEQAIRMGNWKQYHTNLKQLADYPLVHYLQRDRLIRLLPRTDPKNIESFLEKYANQPVTRKLRIHWLKWLAKNNQQSLFLRHYRAVGMQSLECHYLRFKLNQSTHKSDIYNQIKQLWLTAKSLPKACDKLLRIWKQDGQLNSATIWQRILLTTEAENQRLTGYLIRQLAKPFREAGELLQKVIKNPTSLANIKFKIPLTQKARDIISVGLTKLAWKDPDKAIKLWQRLSIEDLTVKKANALRRVIALSLAIDKDPRAVNWLKAIENPDSSVKQWLLSSYMVKQDWPAIKSLTTIYANQASNHNQWIYWLAVAEHQLGQTARAEELFNSIANKRSYYGFLAASRLNKNANLQIQTAQYDQPTLSLIEAHPAAIRAKEFIQLNRMTDARYQWNYLTSIQGKGKYLELAVLAHQWGWQHQAILAFAKSSEIDDVIKRFPLEYLPIYQEQAKRNKIPLSWAYAITRQESAFKTDAISPAGARGLMQLTHETAKQTAKNRLPYSNKSQLLQAEVNILLGIAHLGELYQTFNNQPVFATAAYNAGKSKVQSWIKKSSTLEPIEWIEQIPYKETREYVKNVLTYQLIYAHLTDQSDTFINQITQPSQAEIKIPVVATVSP